MKLAKTLVDEWQDKVKLAREGVELNGGSAEDALNQFQATKRALDKANERKRVIDADIASYFDDFKRQVSMLQAADIHEVLTLLTHQTPRKSTLLAFLAYGILFNILPGNAILESVKVASLVSSSPSNDLLDDAQSCKGWLEKVVKVMTTNLTNIARRLATFRLDIFRQQNGVNNTIQAAVTGLHSMFRGVTAAETELIFNSSKLSKKNNSMRSSFSSLLTQFDFPLLSKLKLERYLNVFSDPLDEDGSDTQLELSPSGKFVPIKSEKSFKRTIIPLSTSSLSCFGEPADGEPISTCLFVDVMRLLLQALHNAGERREESATVEKEILHCTKDYTTSLETHSTVSKTHNRSLEHLFAREKELIFRLKHFKRMRETVETNSHKLRVNRLLNLISSTGYTAVSLAGGFI